MATQIPPASTVRPDAGAPVRGAGLSGPVGGGPGPRRTLRCAIYTRKSSEEGLEQEFNSLDAQYEACSAYITALRSEGWRQMAERFDDGGISGGTLERPGLQRLLALVEARQVDVIIVYKIDRLTRSLSDFSRLAERFEARGVSFVSVTQQFNTSSSMGRLMLNVLLSFAQFEREVTAERIRDKIAASKKKGMWMGGTVPLGYRLKDRKLVPEPATAALIGQIYQRYLQLGSVPQLRQALDHEGITTPVRTLGTGRVQGGKPFTRGHLYRLLASPVYIGRVPHRAASYPGQHEAIIAQPLWDQVQAQLAANDQGGRKRRRHPDRGGPERGGPERGGTAGQGAAGGGDQPGVLTALLRTGTGHRFTLTHTIKSGRRYHYYVEEWQSAGQQAGNGSAPPPQRYNVRTLDNAVRAALGAQLADVPQMIRKLGLTEASEILQLQARVAGPSGQSAADLAGQLIPLLERITLASGAITFSMPDRALRQVLGLDAEALKHPDDHQASVHQARDHQASDHQARPDAADHQPGLGVLEAAAQQAPDDRVPRQVQLTVPLAIRRRGVETKLQVAVLPAHIDPTLVRLVALAHHWRTQLITGEAASIAALAARHQVTGSYITRVLRLALLSPAITRQILTGTQPSHWSAQDLMHDAELPHEWDLQMRWLAQA